MWTRRQSTGWSNYWCTGLSKKASYEDFSLEGTGALSKTLLYGNLGYDRVRREANDSMVRIFQDDGAATFSSVPCCNCLRGINGTGLALVCRQFNHYCVKPIFSFIASGSFSTFRSRRAIFV